MWSASSFVRRYAMDGWTWACALLPVLRDGAMEGSANAAMDKVAAPMKART
jgi:hypothetical protein